MIDIYFVQCIIEVLAIINILIINIMHITWRAYEKKKSFYVGSKKKIKKKRNLEYKEQTRRGIWVIYLVGIVVAISYIICLSYMSHSDQPQPEKPTTALACYKERKTKHNLPSAPDPFIGRNIKVEQIMTLLEGNEIDIISINGPPAFGKSALAIHVGYSALGSRMDVFYIDVSESHRFFREKKSIEVSPLGHATNTDSDLADIVRSFTNSTLLILDDIDSILVDARENFRKIIAKIREIAFQRNSKLKILMTSQIHVTFLDRFQQILINGLDPGAAVQLLNKLVHVNESMSSKLVELVGYCPLTIKVVAALLRKPGMEGGAWLLSKLERSGISSSCLDHTLAVNECWKAVMDIAYSRLDAKGKECGHLVSYFPGSFDEFAAEHILQYDCQFTLVDASLLKRYTHMNSEMVRYTMHNLIRDYFRRINVKNSDIKQRFSALFQHYYSNLVLNISNVTLQAGPSSADDYFQIESHNWNELVHKTIIMSGKISDKLLLSISFIHYKHLLPSNASWLRIFKIYNKPQFSIVCKRFGQTICSEILLDTVKNINETRPPLSCSILRIIENVTKKEAKQLSSELCHCTTYRNMIYYLVFMPYIAAIGVSIIHIISNIFFFNIMNEMYHHIYNSIITTLCIYFIYSALYLHIQFLIHPVLKWLCLIEWYIEGSQFLFFIIFFDVNIWILDKLISTLNVTMYYYNPYFYVIFFSCGLVISFYIPEVFSSDDYRVYGWWAHCFTFLCFSLFLPFLLITGVIEVEFVYIEYSYLLYVYRNYLPSIYIYIMLLRLLPLLTIIIFFLVFIVYIVHRSYD